MAQYLVLVYSDEQAWEGLDEAQRNEVFKQYERVESKNSHIIKAASELAPTSTATSIRSKDDVSFIVTDGAFVETKEALGGYFLIDVKSLDEAISFAKQLPLVTGGVEVRPLAFG